MDMDWEKTIFFSGPSRGGLFQCVQMDGKDINNEFLDENSFQLEKSKATQVETVSIPFKREYEGTVYTIHRACTKLSK